MKEKIELVLLRHGMCPGNQEKRYLGCTDESLSPEGKKALAERAEGSIPKPVDVVITTGMKRCLESCAILYPDAKLIVEDGLRERDFGRFEYRNYEELNGDPDYQAWIDSNGEIAFPGGEDRKTFDSRVRKAFARALGEALAYLQETDYEEGRIAFVVHGGTIMSLCSMFSGDEKSYFDYQCANGEGFLCRMYFESDKMHFGKPRKLS